MNLVADEIMRARWSRTLRMELNDDVLSGDFARGGLGRHLLHPTARIMLLPEDPETDVVEIDEKFWSWVEEVRSVPVAGRRSKFANNHRGFSNGALLIDNFGDNTWGSYAAIYRSGIVEHGLADRASATYRQRPDGDLITQFSLTGIVIGVWTALSLTALLDHRTGVSAKRLLVVALSGTNGAQLGGFGTGWIEPTDMRSHDHLCEEEAILWTIVVDGIASEEIRRSIAFSVGDRIENAWGSTRRRYLDATGDCADEFNPARIRE